MEITATPQRNLKGIDDGLPERRLVKNSKRENSPECFTGTALWLKPTYIPIPSSLVQITCEVNSLEKVPTLEELEAGRSPKGGYTRETLASWGVPWPPPKGWLEELRRQALSTYAQRSGNPQP